MYFDRRRNQFLYFDPMTDDEFRVFWRKMLAREYTYVYTYRREVAGFISCRRQKGKSSHSAHISPVIVKKGYLRKGIGCRLMEFLLKKLKYNSDIKRVDLEVNSDNKKAVRFFRKFGFEIEAVMKKNTMRDGELVDDFLMAKFFK